MVSNSAQFLRANLLKLEEEANYCPQLVAWLVGLLAVFCFGANEFAFFENEKYDSNPYKGFFFDKMDPHSTDSKKMLITRFQYWFPVGSQFI
jgi:hypothetical protein